MRLIDGAHFKISLHARHRFKERGIDPDLIKVVLTSSENITILKLRMA